MLSAVDEITADAFWILSMINEPIQCAGHRMLANHQDGIYFIIQTLQANRRQGIEPNQGCGGMKTCA